ncbi:uncharacterized protein LTR77_001159 [Saxophila tyrrhenica]|uniref:FAD-binding domain-containing protein n=1 Tax=Saxophila tyrrhenica TaxID=1690608 RepID=A0AAV9PP82_9PEZI|nr:hypothetical protein LTR77_001159 [Saxophila tyrrhenica]
MPSMSQPQISIIGAGVSGLVLGRCLLHRGIPAVLYDKDAPRSGSARHGYGITLHRETYKPLLKYIGLDETAFRRRVAVDSAVNGIGRISNHGRDSDASSFRANRAKLENLLSEGLDIRWDHGLSSLTSENSTNSLTFSNGQQVQSSLVVGVDGVHSSVRKSISPNTDFTVLPFAVYNGKRRLSRSAFGQDYAPYMDSTNLVEHRQGQTLLQISTNDMTANEVSISYIYSRPSHAQPDALFTPDRPKTAATDIPSALFDEIATLKDLPPPFRDVFNPATMRKDRLLNWLMRSLLVPASDLENAAERGIVLIGDAMHATPILGGEGANWAIEDGIALAEWIVEKGGEGFGGFLEGRYGRWKEAIGQGERELEGMHGVGRASL